MIMCQDHVPLCVNVQDGTPLLLPPAKRGFSIITEHLLENGCDPNLKDKVLMAASVRCELTTLTTAKPEHTHIACTCSC